MTENYFNTFKPSAYARVFGRALVNQCQQTQYNDPMYVCSADENSGDGHLVLSVNIDNKEEDDLSSSFLLLSLLLLKTIIKSN